MGEGAAPTPGKAHELALKGAETDGTKRALATFGNPFGLALYDPEQAGVGRPRGEKACDPDDSGPWVLRTATGSSQKTLEKPEGFAAALRDVMEKAEDIEALFAVWEQNVETVRAINRHLRSRAPVSGALAQDLVAHLKACAVSLGQPRDNADASRGEHVTPANGKSSAKASHIKIDKSALRFGEPKRIRSKEHLRFVAQQPCLICGRKPSQAHHVRLCAGKEVLGSRLATSSPCRYARHTTAKTTERVMRNGGGRNTKSIRSKWPKNCGGRQRAHKNPLIDVFSGIRGLDSALCQTAIRQVDRVSRQHVWCRSIWPLHAIRITLPEKNSLATAMPSRQWRRPGQTWAAAIFIFAASP